MGEHEREEARPVTELQARHRPGGLQSQGSGRRAAALAGLPALAVWRNPAEVLSSVLFRVFLKAEAVGQAVSKWKLPLAPPARVACGSRTESSCCFVLTLLIYRCIRGVFVPLKPHTVPFNAVWRPSRDIVVPLAWPSQLTLHL